MRKRIIAVMSIAVVMLGCILSHSINTKDLSVAFAKANDGSSGTVYGTAENPNPEKPSDEFLKPGQHWEQIKTSKGYTGWMAVPVEKDTTPLGSVIAKTYTRNDGTVYGIDKHGYFAMSDTAKSLSTKETPAIVEFAWFINGVMKAGVPASAESIHHPEDAIGDWKCMVIHDPFNENGEKAYHLGTIHMDCLLSKGKEMLSPHIEWNYQLDSSFENSVDESSRNWFLSIGEFTDGWYGAEGTGNMSYRLWTMDDGHQYAWGTATINNSDNNTVVLFR